jgi:hypothetical protein
MKKICHYISENMAWLVLAAAVLAMVFPGAFQHLRPTLIKASKRRTAQSDCD